MFFLFLFKLFVKIYKTVLYTNLIYLPVDLPIIIYFRHKKIMVLGNILIGMRLINFLAVRNWYLNWTFFFWRLFTQVQIYFILQFKVFFLHREFGKTVNIWKILIVFIAIFRRIIWMLHSFFIFITPVILILYYSRNKNFFAGSITN